MVTTSDGFIPNFWLQAPASDTVDRLYSSDFLDFEFDSFGHGVQLPEENFLLDQRPRWDLHRYQSLAESFLTEKFRATDRRQEGDAIDALTRTNRDLASILAQIPHESRAELETMSELLSGPPTIEAALQLVQITIYLSSNNLMKDEVDQITVWILQNVPWHTLRPFFGTKLPTIQAYAERFLLLAIRLGKIGIIKDLLKNPVLKAGVQISGSFLAEAVKSCNVRVTEMLLQAGANPNIIYDYVPALHRAATVEIASLLIRFGADVNGFSFGFPHRLKWTALRIAVARGNVDLVRYLLASGADVDNTVRSELFPEVKFTLLVQATADAGANTANSELFRLLINHGARSSVNKASEVSEACFAIGGIGCRYSCTLQEATAIQLATESGNIEHVEILLEAGADVNAPACGENGQTALQVAITRRHSEIASLLLARGAKVNAQGNSDTVAPRTALGAAVEMNNVEFVHLLLRWGADANAPSFSVFGSTPIEAAKAQPNGSDIVKVLLSHGAVDRTLDSRIELRDAVRRYDLAAVRALIKNGASIDMSIIKGDSPFDGGVSTNRTILHWALEKVPKIYYTDYASIFKYAQPILNVELFRLLVTSIVDINAHQNKTRLEPIIFPALVSRDIRILEMLLDAGIDVNTTYHDLTPLQLAAGMENLNAVRLLLEYGAEMDKVVANNKLATTALQASLYDRHYKSALVLDTFYYLLDYGAKINAPVAARGLSELTSAVKIGDITLVERLLDLGADINSSPAPRDGYTALQAAVSYRRDVQLVELLLNAGADVNAPNPNDYGLTALQEASRNGSLTIVQRLIEAGADVNAPASKRGWTALQAASEGGHIMIAQQLIEAGANVNASSPAIDNNDDVNTALDCAASFGRLDMVHLLLQAGADEHLPHGERYVNAAKEAREGGHVVIAELLEEHRLIYT